MLAKPLGSRVPESAEGIAFEPKWDGFRCLVFRDDDGVTLQGRGRSTSARSGEAEDYVDLGYAFPELVQACTEQLPPGTIVDGEIVLPREGRLDFPALSSRLRPRTEAGGGNIARLAAALPAALVVFDALWIAGDLRSRPLRDRRRALEEMARTWRSPLLLCPQTTDRGLAEHWFATFESAGVDGLIVKSLDEPYQPGVRAQGKVKHQRTADVVVAGWRPHTRPGPDGRPIVGSLLLGLYDDPGLLHYVGVASAFPMNRRAQLVSELSPHALEPDAGHPWRDSGTVRIPGQANRWRAEQAWHALRPDLVAEVTYDQMEGDRFRHVAGFVRWRPDRDPVTCGYGQLERPPASNIATLLG